MYSFKRELFKQLQPIKGEIDQALAVDVLIR